MTLLSVILGLSMIVFLAASTAADSGTADSGTADSGTADSGTADSETDPGHEGPPAVVSPIPVDAADLALVETPPNLVAALSEWADDQTTLPLYVSQHRPDVALGYVAEVERSGGALGDQFQENFPAVTASYRELTGQEPTENSLAFFDYLAGHADVFDAWQEGLETNLRLGTYVATHHGEVGVELDLARRSPAENGVGFLDFLAERGYGDLMDPAQSMVGQFGNLPPGNCGCAVTHDFTANPASWKETANLIDYDGAPLPIIDKRYFAENDGAAGRHRLTRRTKARTSPEIYQQTESGHYTRLEIKLFCFEGSNPQGAQCRSGGCRATLATRILVGARASLYLDPGYKGESRGIAYNRAQLLYSVNDGPQQALFDEGLGIVGLEGLRDWGSSWSTLVGSHVGGYILLEWALSPTDAKDLLLEEEYVGLMAKEQEYQLELRPETFLYGRGEGLFENRAYAYSDTSFLMVGAAHDYVCDAHVTPPDEVLFWRYAAAPAAPYDPEFFRDQIEAFSNLHLHAAPQDLPDDSETSDEGSWEP